ncbi:hypothetical protein ACT1UG_24970 [Bacillus paramycoides]
MKSFLFTMDFSFIGTEKIAIFINREKQLILGMSLNESVLIMRYYN